MYIDRPTELLYSIYSCSKLLREKWHHNNDIFFHLIIPTPTPTQVNALSLILYLRQNFFSVHKLLT